MEFQPFFTPIIFWLDILFSLIAVFLFEIGLGAREDSLVFEEKIKVLNIDYKI